jgi:hypothetical protein
LRSGAEKLDEGRQKRWGAKPKEFQTYELKIKQFANYTNTHQSDVLKDTRFVRF